MGRLGLLLLDGGKGEGEVREGFPPVVGVG